jgi:hypothetical protein
LETEFEHKVRSADLLFGLILLLTVPREIGAGKPILARYGIQPGAARRQFLGLPFVSKRRLRFWFELEHR